MPSSPKNTKGSNSVGARAAGTRGALGNRKETGAEDSSPQIAVKSDPDFMMSLARGLSVIQAFTHASQRMTISQISAKTSLSRAAVRRCLHTLNRLGFVLLEEAKYFSLSPRVLTLSHAYTSSNRLHAAAQPVLEALSGSIHESCSVATLDSDQLLYVARAHVSRIMRIDLSIGSRLPAYCASMGRVLLSHLSQAELDAYLERTKLQRHTARTIVSASKLRKVLSTVRSQGYALVDQELEEGLRSLAVPVTNGSGTVIAAMNIGAQAQRMPLEDVEKLFLPKLAKAARDLSLTLR